MCRQVIRVADLAASLREARKRNQLSIEALADKVGTTPRIISRIERGIMTQAPFQKVFDLCTFYNITIVFEFPDNLDDLI